MNLSVLERMAREGDLSLDAVRYLVGCRGECEWLDFKETLTLERDSELAEFGRDVLALKNSGGGYIVVGVKDKTWEPLGLHAPLPYDSKLLRDKVRYCTGIDLEVDIVQHTLALASKSAQFALVLVRASKKRSKRRSPTLVAKDFRRDEKFGLRRGEIYVRRGDSSIRVSSEEELVAILDRLEDAADQDELGITQRMSPFSVEDGTYRLLEKGFGRFIDRAPLREKALAAVTQDPRIWIVNVHGPGGVGKSALVNWLTYEFYSNRTFEAIIQLSAKDTALTQAGISGCSRSLYSLEQLLDVIADTFQERTPEALPDKRHLAIECLSAWATLLVLDNMETVQDGRILDFVQQLPPESRAKVLLTSRRKTGGWELPVPVNELGPEEVQEFLAVRSAELGIDIPCDAATAAKVWDASGGLPLAIQWILGRYRKDPNLSSVLKSVGAKDSPVLEFSFRNIWALLSADGRKLLGAMSIFDDPPTAIQLAIATELATDRIERALAELSEVTLVTRNTQQSDGQVRYIALPITLSFARHQLENMGDFEVRCRQRVQRYTEEVKLQDSQLYRFRNLFGRYGLQTEQERRAAILCQHGDSELSRGNLDTAEAFFAEARSLAPLSPYVWAMSASYQLNRNRIGVALEHINEACKKATKKSGGLCYAVKARVCDAQHDHYGRVDALAKALEYEPADVVLRHQYGVALSRAGREEDAVTEFTRIIEREMARTTPSETIMMALKTRIMNLQRLGRLQQAREDFEWGCQLLREHPHLAHQGDRFTMMRSDLYTNGDQ